MDMEGWDKSQREKKSPASYRRQTLALFGPNKVRVEIPTKSVQSRARPNVFGRPVVSIIQRGAA